MNFPRSWQMVAIPPFRMAVWCCVILMSATKRPWLILTAAANQKNPARAAMGLSFTKLTLPFTTDAKFIRIGDSLLKGNELGASAEGLIRKADGAIDITGTIIPAYGINAAVGNIPLFGEILTGGKGQGIFGLTFALTAVPWPTRKFSTTPCRPSRRAYCARYLSTMARVRR